MRSSSGKRAKRPAASFALVGDVNAFPDGLTPRGCLLTSVPSLSSVLSPSVAEFGKVLTLFAGLPKTASPVSGDAVGLSIEPE